VAFVELLANGTASVVADIFPPVQVGRHALRDMNTLVLLLRPPIHCDAAPRQEEDVPRKGGLDVRALGR